VVSTKEDFRNVFIDSFFGITSGWDIFNNNFMINVSRLFSWEKYAITINNTVNAIRFRFFLRQKLSFRRQILSIIISKVIITYNRGWFDTSIYQEIGKGGFEFSLTGFKIITNYMDFFGSSKFDYTRN